MIEFLHLSFEYPSGGGGLQDVTLKIPAGTMLGLVGANGSGKSTLLSVIAGLIEPTGGIFRIGGCEGPCVQSDVRSVCRLVMQDADLQIIGATVEEDLLIGRNRTQEMVEKARDMAARFSLLHVWDKPVQTLSWGMKRKLCLAAAMLDEPQVLLLDEPFSGLDYPGILEMRAIIARNKENGLTQVVSSHDLEAFIDQVDSLAVLKNGELAVTGTPEQVLDDVRQYGVRPPASWILDRSILPWDQGEQQ